MAAFAIGIEFLIIILPWVIYGAIVDNIRGKKQPKKKNYNDDYQYLRDQNEMFYVGYLNEMNRRNKK